MRKDCSEWFKALLDTGEVRIQHKFEVFYLCSLVGLHWRRKSKASSLGISSTDVIDYFVPPYDNKRGLLLGLLLVGHLEDQGISQDDRAAVRRICGKLFSSRSKAALSSEGYELFNEYASGGFDVLSEHIPDKPNSLPPFLLRFGEILAQGGSPGASLS